MPLSINTQSQRVAVLKVSLTASFDFHLVVNSSGAGLRAALAEEEGKSDDDGTERRLGASNVLCRRYM